MATEQAPKVLKQLGAQADAVFRRELVWEDELWRLTTSYYSEIDGFSYLEPKRVVGDVTALDGAEAASFGPVLARCCSVLKAVTGAELVYVYIFGGTVPHLHVHLAPHRAGDACCEELVRANADLIPETRLRETIARVRSMMQESR